MFNFIKNLLFSRSVDAKTDGTQSVPPVPAVSTSVTNANVLANDKMVELLLQRQDWINQTFVCHVERFTQSEAEEVHRLQQEIFKQLLRIQNRVATDMPVSRQAGFHRENMEGGMYVK